MPTPIAEVRALLDAEDSSAASESVLALWNGQYEFYPESYGAVGDGTTDDTEPLQDCIDAALLVRGKVILGTKTYRITNDLEITDSVQIVGVGPQLIWGGRATAASKSDVFLTVSPYMAGSVLLQTTAATNGITIRVRGREVSLRDFGIRFADAIKFSDTGHGIEVIPPTYVLTGTPDNGVFGGTWDNVSVYGVDGDHYAFQLVNSQLMTINNIMGFGGGGFHLRTDCLESFKGNMTVTNPYFYVCTPGTSHGFYLSHANALNPNNLCVFIRPQCIIDTAPGLDPPISGQKHWKWDVNTHSISVFGSDFEGGVSGTGSPVIPVPTSALFPKNNYFHGYHATADNSQPMGEISPIFGAEAFDAVSNTTRDLTIRGTSFARWRMGSATQENSQFLAQDSNYQQLRVRSGFELKPINTSKIDFLLENQYSSTSTPTTLGFEGAAGGALFFKFGDANHFIRQKVGGNLTLGGFFTVYCLGKHGGTIPAWYDDGGSNAASWEVVGLASSTRLRTSVSLPTYANDAAADADSALLTKEFYKITGSRAVYQKP